MPNIFQRSVALSGGSNTEANKKNILLLNGSFVKDKKGGSGHIVFNSSDKYAFNNSTSNYHVVKTTNVNHLRMFPVAPKQSTNPVISHFTLGGAFQFAEQSAFNLFSFTGADAAEQLAFNNYAFEIKTQITGDTAKITGIEPKFPLLQVSQNGIKGAVTPMPNSLLDDIPFEVTAFRAHSDGSTITDSNTGGINIDASEIPNLHTKYWQSGTKGSQFAIEFTAPMGHLGALQKSRHLIKSSILLGWQTNGKDDKVGAIFLPPSGMSSNGSFNLQGVLKGSFEGVKLCQNDFGTKKLYAVELSGVSMHLLKLPVLQTTMPWDSNNPYYKSSGNPSVNSRMSIFGGKNLPAAPSRMLALAAGGKHHNVGWATNFDGDGKIEISARKTEAEKLAKINENPIRYLTKKLLHFNYGGVYFGLGAGIYHNMKLHSGFDTATANGTVIEEIMKVFSQLPNLNKGLFKEMKSGKVFFPMKPNGDEKKEAEAQIYIDKVDPSGGLLTYVALDLLSVQFAAVFADPGFFGGQISVPVPKPDQPKPSKYRVKRWQQKIQKNLGGLIVEIIYRKISDHLGEWAVLVDLPKKIREIKEGEVTIYLPSIGLQVWTDGAFKVALGWPIANKKLSKLGATIPIEGVPVTFKGGMFFAKLHGQDMPGTYATYFDNLYELGFGLDVSVQRKKQKSCYSYEVNVGLGFLIEGMFGALSEKYREKSNSGDNSIDYFWVAGNIHFYASLKASINLGPISAQLGLSGKAVISTAFETKHSALISMDLSASVDVTIKIVFVHIHIHKNFHFNVMTIKIGDGPTASTKQPTPDKVVHANAALIPVMLAAPMVTATALAASTSPQLTAVNQDWSNTTTLASYLRTLQSNLNAKPNSPNPIKAYLVGLPTAVHDGKWTSQLISSLVTETGTLDSPTSPKTFTKLNSNGLSALVEWVLRGMLADLATNTKGGKNELSALPNELLIPVPDSNKIYEQNLRTLAHLYALQQQFPQGGQSVANPWSGWSDLTKKIKSWLKDITVNIDSGDNETYDASKVHLPIPMIPGVSLSLDGGTNYEMPTGIEEHLDAFVQLVAQMTIAELYHWILSAAGSDLCKAITIDWNQVIYNIHSTVTRFALHGSRQNGKSYFADTGLQQPWKYNKATPSPLMAKVANAQGGGFKEVITGTGSVTTALSQTLDLSKVTADPHDFTNGYTLKTMPLYAEIDKAYSLTQNKPVQNIRPTLNLVRFPIAAVQEIRNGDLNLGDQSADVTFIPFQQEQVASFDHHFGLAIPLKLHSLGSTVYRMEAINPDYLEILTETLKSVSATQIASVYLIERTKDGDLKAVNKKITICRSNLAVSDINAGDLSSSPLHAQLNLNGKYNATEGYNFLRLIWEGSIIHQGGYQISTDYAFDKTAGGTTSNGIKKIASSSQTMLVIEFKDLGIPSSLVNAILYSASSPEEGLSLRLKDGTNYVPTYKTTTPAGAANWRFRLPAILTGNLSNHKSKYLQKLYHLTQYQLEVDGKAGDWSAPLGYHEYIDPNTQNKFWEFLVHEHLTKTADPYQLIGKTAQINLRLLDIFGNALDTQLSSASMKIQYTDELVSPVVWSGFGIYYSVKEVASQPTLELSLHYTGTSDTNESKQRTKDYISYSNQINDANLTTKITTSLWNNKTVDNADLLSAFRDMATAIAASPDADQSKTVSITLDPKQLPQQPLFELSVTFSLDRPLSDCNADLVAKIPDVQSITSVIYPNPGTAANPSKGIAAGKPAIGLRQFARDFEAAFINFDQSGTKLKVAQGPRHELSQDHAHSLWIFKWKGLGLNPATVANTDDYGYWAPQPLSHVLVPTKKGHIDLDGEVRQFLRDLHLLQTPSRDAAMAENNSFDELMTYKRALGDTITGTLKPILQSSGNIDKETEGFFKEQLYTSLTHDFGTTTLVALPLSVSNGQQVDNGPSPHFEPYFLGQVSANSPNIEQAFVFSTAQVGVPNKKVPARTNGDHTAFLITAQKAGDNASFQQPLSLDLHSFDYQFHDGDEKFGMLPSKWLTFLVPDTQNNKDLQVGLNTPNIPLPFRQFPNSPHLVSQTAIPSQNSNLDISKLKTELTWDYEVELTPPAAAQDTIYLYIQFNNTDEKLDGFGPKELAWSDLRADQKDFVNALETFKTQARTVLKSTSYNLSDVTNLLTTVGKVSKNYPTTTWGTTQDVSKVAVGTLDIILSISKTGSDYEVKVIKQGSSANYTPTKPQLKDGKLQIAVKGLKIVTHQSAKSFAFVGRNEQLITGEATNQTFIYQSPVVKFSSTVAPFIEDNSVHTIKSGNPVSNQIQVILETFIAKNANKIGLEKEVRFRINVNVLKQIAGQTGTDTPELLTPITTYSDDLSDPVKLPKSFTDKLSGIKSWQAINLDLLIYSSISVNGNKQSPLVHLSKIVLTK